MRAAAWLAQHGRGAACAAAGLLLPAVAAAQLSASASWESDYRFRGLSLSGSKPSVRLSANVDATSGAYAGLSATQADVSQGEAYAQWLGYAGYARPLSAGTSVEFGASYSHFSGNHRYDFGEAYAGLLAARWSLRLHYSPDYFGRKVRTAYLDASGHLPLNDSLRLFGHVGLLAPIAPNAAGPPGANRVRADIRAGAGWSWQDIDLQLAYVAASPGGPFPAPYAQRRGSLVLGANYSF